MTVYADRVRETTSTIGTGQYTLSGAVSGFRSFSSALSTGSVITYCVEDGTNWEICEGTLTIGSPSTVTRTTVLASSNNNTAVGWGAGAKNIYVTISAIRLITSDKDNTLSGNLGVGGVATGKFDVVGTMGRVSVNALADQLSLNFAGFNYLTASGVGATLQIQATDAAGKLTFATAGVERMRIGSTGNVGIGVTNPDAPLVLLANSAAYGLITRGRASDNASLISFKSNDNVTERAKIESQGDGLLTFSNGGAKTLYVSTTGNVGIGAASAGEKLKIVGTSGTNQLGVGTSANAVFFNAFDSAGMYMTATATNSTQFGIGTASSIPLSLMTGNAERARIDTSGNLMVGISSTAARLHVQGSGGANDLGFFQQGGTSGAVLVINHQDALGTNPGGRPVLSMRKGNTTSFNLSVDGTTPGATYYDAISATGQHHFFTNGTARLSVRESGLVGIGTSTPTASLDVNGDTIRLRTSKTPATATATGNVGDQCWDANYVYVCVATNTWKRAALTTW